MMKLYQFFIVAAGIWAMHRENHKEQKSFHGKLCALEEKHIQIMQRIMEKK